MNKTLRLLLFSLLFSSFSYGQTDFSETLHNNACVEFFGNGGLYSINYERMVVHHFAVRIGFASWSASDLFGAGQKSITTVPVLCNLLTGEKK